MRKNLTNLLAAISHISHKDIFLVVVGNKDWKAPDLSKLIKHFGIEERVILINRASDEDLPLIYSLATVLCSPSFAEAFGLPALEAMAAGVPVVVSDTTSMPEDMWTGRELCPS